MNFQYHKLPYDKNCQHLEHILFSKDPVSPANNCQFLSPPGIKVLSFFMLVFSYIGIVKSETVWWQCPRVGQIFLLHFKKCPQTWDMATSQIPTLEDPHYE